MAKSTGDESMTVLQRIENRDLNLWVCQKDVGFDRCVQLEEHTADVESVRSIDRDNRLWVTYEVETVQVPVTDRI